MKLIGTPTSPYTRKARVVLAEKRIDYEFIVDAPYDDATQVPHGPSLALLFPGGLSPRARRRRTKVTG